jgi:hypothetical protein
VTIPLRCRLGLHRWRAVHRESYYRFNPNQADGETWSAREGLACDGCGEVRWQPTYYKQVKYAMPYQGPKNPAERRLLEAYRNRWEWTDARWRLSRIPERGSWMQRTFHQGPLVSGFLTGVLVAFLALQWITRG